MDDLIKQAAQILSQAKMTIALTGAGISVESGIPDFRSAGGLWSKYDPAEYATISAFMKNPAKVWKMLREMEELVVRARPNRAHIGMGELEKMGLLNYIITQNVDNLHQDGGSVNVIEYHGNCSTLSCPQCDKGYRAGEKDAEYPPRCDCGAILKPDVVFFGEAIPAEALATSFQLASTTEVLIVVATSAVVYPANTIPDIAKKNKAKIIEINKERTYLTDSVTDLFIQGDAGEIIERLVSALK